MAVVKAVLVTGASTGIGRKITERLAGAGHLVYAGARRDSDLDELAAIENVRPLRLDVTSSQDIAAAVAAISRAGRGLYALVNNAGIVTIGPVVGSNDEEFDLVMAVNVHGPYRMVKALAPLIVAARGRIVTIGSIAGIAAGKDRSAYCMSKHAMEAFTDCLASEMEPLGVHVSVIEPGNFETELLKNAVRRSAADPGVLSRSKCKDLERIAAAVSHALFEPTPRRRYLVVPNRDEAEATIRAHIVRLAQLNEEHAYPLERRVLISMLDEAIAQARAYHESQYGKALT